MALRYKVSNRGSEMLHTTWSLVAVVLSLAAVAAPQDQPAAAPVPLFDNLGTHTYRITTSAPLAQSYFDQGLRLYYGFNHAEAIRAFEEATRRDAECAMCYWGIALAYGPNINAPMERDAALAAYGAMQKAVAREAKASAAERALIRALSRRYAADPPQNRASLDAAYATALRDVVRQYPDDLEVATLLAEALMDLSPWNYWTPEGQPRDDTREILAQLERVMARNPDHPGANHFYIHAVEAVQPEKALPAAERLAALMPGAGHIVHMPGHIYVRVGRYLDAIAANEHAVHADETYIRDQRPGAGAYTVGYYPHNYDFLAFAASMIGRSKQSIGAAEKMTALVPVDMARQPGMTFAQHHLTRHLQMKVRFARWADILAVPAPPEDLPYARAMWQYARGRAMAARGNVADAQAALAQVRAAAQDASVAQLRLEFNTAGTLLGLASEVLAGHVAAADGDLGGAIRHLQAGARLEDALTYGEPPEWSVPVRQELGMVLLRSGDAAAAERVFREDLTRFPDNGWSLRGLELSLVAQNRRQDAANVKTQLDRVWATADVQMPGASDR
jgi:tetratricopeptide (TPR) repeat protein